MQERREEEADKIAAIEQAEELEMAK